MVGGLVVACREKGEGVRDAMVVLQGAVPRRVGFGG